MAYKLLLLLFFAPTKKTAYNNWLHGIQIIIIHISRTYQKSAYNKVFCFSDPCIKFPCPS